MTYRCDFSTVSSLPHSSIYSPHIANLLPAAWLYNLTNPLIHIFLTSGDETHPISWLSVIGMAYFLVGSWRALWKASMKSTWKEEVHNQLLNDLTKLDNQLYIYIYIYFFKKAANSRWWEGMQSLWICSGILTEEIYCIYNPGLIIRIQICSNVPTIYRYEHCLPTSGNHAAPPSKNKHQQTES